jgi:hypothetical protein
MSSNRCAPFTTTRKPHCNHCQKTGEPESVYSSHFASGLPDQNGKKTVTCPKILSTECSYCYKIGHLRSYCPVKEKNEQLDQRKAKEISRKPEEKKKVVQFDTPNRGGFGCLGDDSDEETPMKLLPPKKEEFPLLSAAPVPIKTEISGYAAAAAKLPVLEPAYTSHMSNFRILQKGDRMMKTEVVKPVIRRNWCDPDSSSSEESDVEEEVIPQKIQKIIVKGKSAFNDPWAEDHAEFAGVTVGGWGAYFDEL